MDWENKEDFTNKKSVVIGIIVLLLIVLSFWLSFSLGKKVFAPLKPEDKELFEISSEAEEKEKQVGENTQLDVEKKAEVELPQVEIKVTPIEGAVTTKKESPDFSTGKKVVPQEVKQEKVEVRPTGTIATPKKQEPVRKETPEDSSGKKWVFYYKVLAGSFSNEVNARQLANQLQAKGFSTYIDKVTVGGQKFYRVQTGAFTSQKEADSLLSSLKAKGFEGAVVIE